MLNRILKVLDPLVDLEPIPAVRRNKLSIARESWKTLHAGRDLGDNHIR